MVGRGRAARWQIPLVVEMRDAWPDLVTHVGPAGAIPAEVAHAPHPGLLRRASRWAVVLAKGQVHQNVTGWQRGAQAVVTTTDRFADVLVERGIDRVERSEERGVGKGCGS